MTFFCLLNFVAISSSWTTFEPGTEEAGLLIFFSYFRGSSNHLNSFVKLLIATSQPFFLSSGACRVCACWERAGERERERERERKRERERERERATKLHMIVACLERCAVSLSVTTIIGIALQLFDGQHPYGGGPRTAGPKLRKRKKKKPLVRLRRSRPCNVRPGETKNQSAAWSESFCVDSMPGFPTSLFSSCSLCAFYILFAAHILPSESDRGGQLPDVQASAIGAFKVQDGRICWPWKTRPQLKKVGCYSFELLHKSQR